MTVEAKAAVTLYAAKQLVRAKRSLRRRLYKEMETYGSPNQIDYMTGMSVPYNGKGDRFEFRVGFRDSRIRSYEVTVYGPGRSYRIWEI